MSFLSHLGQLDAGGFWSSCTRHPLRREQHRLLIPMGSRQIKQPQKNLAVARCVFRPKALFFHMNLRFAPSIDVMLNGKEIGKNKKGTDLE